MVGVVGTGGGGATGVVGGAAGTAPEATGGGWEEGGGTGVDEPAGVGTGLDEGWDLRRLLIPVSGSEVQGRGYGITPPRTGAEGNCIHF